MHQYILRLGNPWDAVSYTAMIEASTPEAAADALQTHMATRWYTGTMSQSPLDDLVTDVMIWHRGHRGLNAKLPVIWVKVHISPACITSEHVIMIDGQHVDGPCLCGAAMGPDGHCDEDDCAVSGAHPNGIPIVRFDPSDMTAPLIGHSERNPDSDPDPDDPSECRRCGRDPRMGCICGG